MLNNVSTIFLVPKGRRTAPPEWFVQRFHHLDETVVEVVVSHFPQSLMASTTESLLEVDGVVVQVTLVLQMLFNYQPGVR